MKLKDIMDTNGSNTPKIVIVGLCLSLLAILFGFILGGLFGIMEGQLKGALNESGTAVVDTVYKGNVAAKDAVVAKSWEYLKRAHLHGGAIGTAGVGAILTLMILCRMGPIARYSALALGLGALLYSVFWLFAGFMAPGLGSTGLAKENLWFLAIPGAGLAISGLVGTIFCVIKDVFCKSNRV